MRKQPNEQANKILHSSFFFGANILEISLNGWNIIAIFHVQLNMMSHWLYGTQRRPMYSTHYTGEHFEQPIVIR